MASLWKRNNSKFWTACFTAPDGRQLKRSTKTTDRKLAVKLANSWEEAARRRITEGQARRVISDIYAMVSGDGLSASNIREFFDSWLTRKKLETGPSTFTKYRNTATQFLAFLGDRAGTELSHLTSKDIAKYRDSLTERLSGSTANLELKILRSALGHAKAEGLIIENVAQRVRPVALRVGIERRAFTLTELKILIDAADHEWKGMILFGLYTGQRLKDISTLTWQHLDLNRNELRFVTGKTGRRQIIPLARPLLKFIAAMKAGDDPKQPLFPKAYGVVERTGLVGTLSGQFYELMAEVGMVPPRTHQKTGDGRSVKRTQSEISFHCLRHTATSLLKNAGVSDAVAQEFIGHDSPEISRNYTHIETEALRKAADTMPDILK